MDFPIREITPDAYPESLNQIPDPPEKLYLRGAAIDPSKRMIAFVGARRYSPYGKKACEAIIQSLAPYPISIVSGLAIGIDAIAHQAALRAGLNTIAIVGSGLADETLYPSSNRSLAHQILEKKGTLISELTPNTEAARHTFPSRNRIMAGLSEVVIAVECEERSGTRITTRLATEYNKEVGAVPHTIFSEIGTGTNALIHQGAHIIRSADDILPLLGIDKTKEPDIIASTLKTLTDNEQVVFDALTHPKTKTALAQETGLPTHTLQAALALLEMKHLTNEMLGTIERKK